MNLNYESNSNNIETRRRRRNRNDQHQRNYICPCGKSYLSYPALYTHIKNKHQGQAPTSGQIIPKTYERIHHHVRQEPESEYQRHLTKPDEALVATINLFRSYSPNKQLNYTLKEIFEPFEEDLKKQIESSTQAWINGDPPQQKILDSGIRAASIDQIISKFISLLINKIDKAIMVEFVLVLLIFRKHINEHFLREGVKGDYCRQGSGVKMLETVNQFLLYYFNFILKRSKIDIKNACFIGRNNREFICVGRFLFLFGRWAYLERYTNSKLRMNNL